MPNISRTTPLTATVPLRGTERILSDLRLLGFERSYWHRTVGKLTDLLRSAPEKYDAYIAFFAAIHKDLKMPSLRLTLILPPAQSLAAMEVEVLNRNLAFIRQNYVSVNHRTCDLRPLLEDYANLH